MADTPHNSHHATGTRLTWLVLLLALAGLGISQVSTNIFAIGQIFSGPQAAGGWIGIQNAIGNVSGIISPIVTGILIDQLGGYGWGFALAAGVCAAGALWWWKMIPPIKQIEV